MSVVESTSEDLLYISQLIDQLRHEDINLRINAAKNIIKIAITLGPERTKNELIPFVGESIDDEDAVVIIYAEKLGELINYVGGVNYYYKVLEILSFLCAAEETAIREMTIQSLIKVIQVLPDEHIELYYVPLVTKLCARDWYTSRAAATCILPTAYNRLKESRRQSIKDMFVKLCSDDTPVVRKLAARNLSTLCCEIMKVEKLLPNEFIRVFTVLANDDQDSVRIENIINGVAFGQLLTVEQKLTHLLPIIIKMGDDKAWRVRWCLVQKLYELGKAILSLPVNTNDSTGINTKHINVEPENYTNIQITIVNTLEIIAENLLNDNESEVRAAAAANIQHFSKLFRKDRIVSLIIPCIQKLSIDSSSEYVRSSAATCINELSVLIGKDATVEYLLPQLLLLLRDSSSSVRLGIISNLDVLNRVIGVELLSQSLLPAIIELANDSKWRVRIAIIELMPMLVSQLGIKFFTDKLSDLTLNWLMDRVYAIRRAAADNLKSLTEQFGETWAINCIIPKLQLLKMNDNYLYRIICLYVIQNIVNYFTINGIIEYLLPITLDLIKDNVANIRFTAAKTLAFLYPIISKGNDGKYDHILNQIKIKLNQLNNDDIDKDVKYFVQQTLAKISA